MTFLRTCAALLLILAVVPAFAADDKLSPADEQAIRAVMDTYREAWLANDAEGVLGLFTKDAVIMPHHGDEPRAGIEALRKFWFPPDSPPTPLIYFRTQVDQLGGSGRMAFVRGRFQLSWTQKDDKVEKTYTNAGTSLTLLRKSSDGRWKITHQMWDDPAPRVEVRTPKL